MGNIMYVRRSETTLGCKETEWQCITGDLIDVMYDSCVLMEYVCVFFCKQKTAYEMRISDWSSDVCSSDLLTQVVFEEGGTAWAGDDDFALGERLGAFRHTRCHPIEKLVLPGPSVIGVRELYWPTRTLAEQGIAAAGDAFHALFSRAPKAQTIFSISERYV